MIGKKKEFQKTTAIKRAIIPATIPALIICLIIILIAGIFLVLFSENQIPEAKAISKTGLALNATQQNPLQEKRNNYGFSSAVFENLPAPKNDFEKLVIQLRDNGYSNYNFFSKEYFLQPEFYPSFNENAFSYWTKPDPNYYAAMGYGFYPQKQEIELKAGETTATSFFVHAGWGVQSNQGIRIEQQGLPQGFTVKIVEPEFLLGYSYPKFSENWAHKVQVLVFAQNNVSPGSYKIFFTAKNPSPQNSEKWKNNSGRKYFDIENSNAKFSAEITIKVI